MSKRSFQAVIFPFKAYSYRVINMKLSIKLGDFVIGPGNPCFIIAEAGVNHNGNINLAHQLVDQAFNVGANAIKFQSFKHFHLSLNKL